ncbi:MAG: acyltransferase [Candidatus Micrarchaeota archaeon]
MPSKNVFVHRTAEVSDGASVGEGTRIWHQSQVRETARVGKNCNIGKGVYIDVGVEIGDNVKLQNYACVYQGVRIESDAFVGPHVCFTNDLRPRSFSKDWKIISTVVRRGASLGANSTVVCGVEIGEYAMVGAGSVVADDVPAHCLVFGNPAKLHGFVCRCGARLKGKGKKARGIVSLKCGNCAFEVKIPARVFQKL